MKTINVSEYITIECRDKKDPLPITLTIIEDITHIELCAGELTAEEANRLAVELFKVSLHYLIKKPHAKRHLTIKDFEDGKRVTTTTA